jgi:hypothetical protein
MSTEGVGLPRIPVPLTRQQMASLAQAIVDTLGEALPETRELRVVLCITDDEGAFVGVGMSVPLEDGLGILRAALAREGAIDHGKDRP